MTMSLTFVLALGCLGVLLTNAIVLDRFGSKTTYTWSKNTTGGIPAVPVDAATSFTHGNGMCEAVTVYIVARHGTRYPSDGAIEDMPGVINKIRTYKDPMDFTGFDSWTNRYDIARESTLVQEGIDELIGLGERFARRFTTLFNMHGSLVKFVSSEKTRASNSSKYFHQGMASQLNNFPAYTNEENNTIVRFYDDCTNFEEGVEDNTTHMMEFTKYSNTSDFMSVMEAVKNRLDLSDNADLTADDIYMMYEMCAYEMYMFDETLWCTLLTDAEREILEYGQDIEKYWETRDTAPVIKRMTCPLLNDILHTMDSSMNETWDYMSSMTDFSNTGYMAGKFVFGHSETILPLFTTLGLFNDNMHLLASNRAAMTNRNFRISHIDPFSANLALVMYACNDTSGGQTGQSFVVKAWVNEEAVTIPACNNEICSFMEFKDYYSPMGANCNLTEICEGSDDDGDDDTNGTNYVIAQVLSLILPLFITLYF